MNYLNNIQKLIQEYEITKNERLLIYAILELRMCIENIAENILKQYSNILSDKDKKKRKATDIMRLLSKYEEHINLDYALHIGFENNSNQKFFGGEYKALPKKKKLSKIYDDLVGYLHYNKASKVITVEQLEEKLSHIEHIIKNKNQIYVALQENINFDCEICGRRNIFSEYYIKNNSTINCQHEDCNMLLRPIIKNGEYKFEPIEPNIKCECGKHTYYQIAPEKLYMGYKFQCHSCNKIYKISSFTLTLE